MDEVGQVGYSYLNQVPSIKSHHIRDVHTKIDYERGNVTVGKKE